MTRAKPILYYSNEQSLRLFKKQREKELENEIIQLTKNEAIRNNELFNEGEADTLAKLYKKTMEKVGQLKREPKVLSTEENIKRLIKQKENEKQTLKIGTLPTLTTPDPVPTSELISGFPNIPPASTTKKPLNENIINRPNITPEMINNILSKFKPIDETKLNDEIRKNAEEFKKNSNNPLNNLLMNELKQKLLTMNEKKKSNEDKLIMKELGNLVVNRMRQVSELEQMAGEDKNIQNVVEEVLKKTNDDIDELESVSSSQAPTVNTSISGQPKGENLNETLLKLYDVQSRGNNFYKSLFDRINSLPENVKNNSKKILKQAYQSKFGESTGWQNKNPKNLSEATEIIENYIQMGGQGIKKKKIRKN